jgi:LAS superfamily LD-carboxypeptidase LdcB
VDTGPRTAARSSASLLHLVGQWTAHLSSSDETERLGAPVHRDVVGAFLQLRAAAAEAGFDLAILSGFRSFEQQLSIWNRKAGGALAVLDSDARPLDITLLSDRELVFSILRWSALPGASRHHWGTDLDIYDRAAKPDGYTVELIPAEVESGGMFAPLHEWLDRRIEAGSSFGFLRPYDADRNGVAPERWHVSYAPVASAYAQLLTPRFLRETIQQADMRLRDVVLQNLDAIYERFVINTNPAFR